MLAAARFSGLELDRLDVWCVALLGAFACGVSWWLEHRTVEPEVARKLDRRLRHQGALVTAYELERRGDDAPITRLLIARVLHRLRRAEALRAMLPPLGVPVAAPFLGAALVAVALDSNRPEPPAPQIGTVGTGMAQQMDELRRAVVRTEGPYLDTAQKVMELARDARMLERNLNEAGRSEKPLAELRPEIDRIDYELAALSPDVARQDELFSKLAAVRNSLDALRQGLGELGGGGRRESDDAGPAGPAGPDGGGSGEGGELTGPGGDGTMSRPHAAPLPPAGGAGALAEAPSGAPEAGSSGERWWPPRHDEVRRALGWSPAALLFETERGTGSDRYVQEWTNPRKVGASASG